MSAQKPVQYATSSGKKPEVENYKGFKSKPVVTKSNGVGLFASPGTGKSLMAVSLVTLSKAKRVLILCPVSVLGVWPREFERHSNGSYTLAPLRRLDIKSPMSTDAKAKMAQKYIDQADEDETNLVMVINYESAWRAGLAKVLNSVDWDMIVLDESHKIKNPDSKISRFCRSLAQNNPASHRLALTGTPTGGSCLDLYAQISFLNNAVFGNNYTAFKKRYVKENSYGQVKQSINQEDLRRRVDGISFTATEEVLRGSLPPVTHTRLDTEITGEAFELYQSVEQGFMAELASEENEAILARIIIVQLLRLSQLTSGFAGVVDLENPDAETKIRRIKGSSKLDALRDVIEATPKGEKFVVFARFTEELAMIRELAESMGLKTGEISGKSKDGLTADSEMREDIDLVAVQLQSGSSGIDLTRATRVVYYALSFSFLDHQQSLFRVHRPGQENHVFMTYLITPGTIDEKIFEALERKENVASYFKAKALAIQAADPDYD